MLSNLLSSPRSVLSAEQTVYLVNSYLETARKTADIHIASILCNDAEVSLSEAKHTFKRVFSSKEPADEALRNKIATVYFERGEL